MFRVGVQLSKAVESGGTFCCDGKKGGVQCFFTCSVGVRSTTILSALLENRRAALNLSLPHAVFFYASSASKLL